MSPVVRNNRDFDIPKECMGQYIFKILNQQHDDHIVNVDGATGKTLTSAQLLQDSIKLTTIFSNLGMKKGDSVAIINENSIENMAVILAGLFTGVVVCVLNPKYSPNEMQHGLASSRPKLVACCESAFHTVTNVLNKAGFIKKIYLTEVEKEDPSNDNILKNVLAMTPFNKAFKPLYVDPFEDNAAICLSSGTTGLPKGVMLTQGAIRQNIGFLTHPNCVAGASTDVTLLVIPMFHIFGFMISISFVVNKVKTVLVKKFEPEPFLKYIQDYKVSLMFLVPSLVVFFAKSSLVNKFNISSLTDIIVGGAPISPEVAKEAKERLNGKVNIRQLYGMTELGGATNIQDKTKPNIESVGQLVPGVSAKICSQIDNNSLGPNEIGELCFKSLAMMKGYIDEEGLNPLHFDRDGFYHSGDLGYYDENNYFYVVDRIKELIKCKGFQVPPAELEALLMNHPDVQDCGVIGIPDERAGELPLAIVVKKENSVVTEKEIVEYVAGKISIQKHLYGGVIFVESIPKNPTGKILRRQLKETYKNYKSSM